MERELFASRRHSYSIQLVYLIANDHYRDVQEVRPNSMIIGVHGLTVKEKKKKKKRNTNNGGALAEQSFTFSCRCIYSHASESYRR